MLFLQTKQIQRKTRSDTQPMEKERTREKREKERVRSLFNIQSKQCVFAQVKTDRCVMIPYLYSRNI